MAWNTHKGAEFFDLKEGDCDPKIIQEGIRAAKVIGQHFSGVDLMVFDGKPYVLELNTVPALSNSHRLEIFTNAFKNVIDFYEQTGELLK